MRTKPLAVLAQNTFDYERKPLIKPTGFREYDARWLFGPELNLLGVQALGLGLGTLLHELGGKPELITGHDYRAYSQSIKQALICGLMMAGIKVHDIGLALSPMAYFAQFALNVPAVAMVTASHNDNGWTGVKMGAQSPFTFGPDEMTRLRDIVLGGAGIERPGGACHYVPDFAATYIADLTHRPKISVIDTNRDMVKRRIDRLCGRGGQNSHEDFPFLPSGLPSRTGSKTAANLCARYFRYQKTPGT